MLYPTVFTAENGQTSWAKKQKTTNDRGAGTSFLGRPIQFVIVMEKLETSHLFASTIGFELDTAAVVK